jgi:hypothetical protein
LTYPGFLEFPHRVRAVSAIVRAPADWEKVCHALFFGDGYVIVLKVYYVPSWEKIDVF